MLGLFLLWMCCILLGIASSFVYYRLKGPTPPNPVLLEPSLPPETAEWDEEFYKLTGKRLTPAGHVSVSVTHVTGNWSEIHSPGLRQEFLGNPWPQLFAQMQRQDWEQIAAQQQASFGQTWAGVLAQTQRHDLAKLEAQQQSDSIGRQELIGGLGQILGFEQQLQNIFGKRKL